MRHEVWVRTFERLVPSYYGLCGLKRQTTIVKTRRDKKYVDEFGYTHIVCGRFEPALFHQDMYSPLDGWVLAKELHF